MVKRLRFLLVIYAGVCVLGMQHPAAPIEWRRADGSLACCRTTVGTTTFLLVWDATRWWHWEQQP